MLKIGIIGDYDPVVSLSSIQSDLSVCSFSGNSLKGGLSVRFIIPSSSMADLRAMCQPKLLATAKNGRS